MAASQWELARELITYADADEAGLAKPLLKAHHEGRLLRVARGAYVPATSVAGAARSVAATQEYLYRVLAAARRLRAPVFTAHSALALLELPIVGSWPAEVYVMSSTAHGSRRPGVVSVARRGEVPTMSVRGLEVTSVEFSLIQVARRVPLLPALVAANAACLRQRFPPECPLTTPEQLRREHERLMPYRGSRRVCAVLDRVRDDAESVLETLSDVAIEELGFAKSRHQVRFELSTGEAYVDFYWEEGRIAGEADGDEKYRRAGAGAAESVIGEKRREDELREQLGGLARWGWQDCWQRTPLEGKLLRAGVPRVRMSRRRA